ncbi:MAG: MlaD family protein [Solirubrobacteraceae bacterium]|nr:MlaD family protein [Solirubrobacteraceae bacterium]
MRGSRPSRLLVVLVLVIAVVVTVIVVTDGDDEHELRATFERATNLVSGARVTAGGTPVGHVGGIERRGDGAEVRLVVTDRRAWPLPEGTTATLRFGGTVSYSNRYVELTRGPEGARPLPDGATLAVADTTSPVEFDDLFDVLDGPGRRALGTAIDHAASTYGGRGPEMARGLRRTGPTLEAATDVATELGADPGALRTLVLAGRRTASALAADLPRLGRLVEDAATTFATVADHAGATRTTLRELPSTLRRARTTLRRTRPTLARLGRLGDDLRPGAARLASLVPRVDRAVRALHVAAPDLDATLRTVGAAAPSVDALLQDAEPLLRRAAPVIEDAVPMVACLRAYAPEIAGFVATWKSLGPFFDANGHYGRVQAQAFPFPNDTPVPPAVIHPLIPNLDYALVRPPGYSAGEPWFLSECGADRAGLDPARDPEARP